MFRENLTRFDRNIEPRAAGNIVDDHRRFDAVGDRGIVFDQPRLCAFVVVRRDEQQQAVERLLADARSLYRLGFDRARILALIEETPLEEKE